MALMSGKIYSNTGAPSNADGVDGDIYLRLDGMKTTYRKESGAWVAIGSTLGAIPEIISGVGAPSNALGVDEQYYRDTGSQDIYYKQGSTWSLVGNLTGATFAPLLDKAGIGKDLATAPNLINSGSLNAVIEVGEYYYNTAVTDTPAPWGLLKVWREHSTTIYQLVQSAGYEGKLYNRYTSDGGVTWGPWVSYASTDLATTTVAGIVKKATQAELNNGTTNVWPDAATLLSGFSQSSSSIRLPEWLGGWLLQWGYTQVGDIGVSNDEPTTVFDVPYSYPPHVMVSGWSDAGQAQLAANVRSVSSSSFVAILSEWNAVLQGPNTGFNWLAIGK